MKSKPVSQTQTQSQRQTKTQTFASIFTSIVAPPALMLALGLTLNLAGPSAAEAKRPHDREAFKAAAEKCGLPKREEMKRGERPTEEQKACMAAAGFSRDKGPRGRAGKRGHHHRPPPDSAPQDSASPDAASPAPEVAPDATTDSSGTL